MAANSKTSAEAATPVSAERRVVHLDDENPWPSLDSFTENAALFFKGRDAENQDLQHRITRRMLTVLFGVSGLGKTSLLEAGVFPSLREEGFMPVRIRLDHTSSLRNDLVEQVRVELRKALDGGRYYAPRGIGPEESLWAYFHQPELEIRDREMGDRVVKTVLVFDQFEEIFSHGQGDPSHEWAQRALIEELAQLIDNRVPPDLKRELERDPAAVRRYDFDNQDYRIVLALREDYLPHLESFYCQIPSITENRCRLLAMNEEQAFEAVKEPGKKIVDPPVAQQIVEFAAGESQGAALPGAPANVQRPASVSPALLSLICSELNDERKRPNAAKITAEQVKNSAGQILQHFYDRCFEGLPHSDKVQEVVDGNLVSGDNYREKISLSTVLSWLQQKTHCTREEAQQIFERLRDRRLVQFDSREGRTAIELTHDVLCVPAAKSRQARLERLAFAQAEKARLEEKEEADRRAEADKKAKDEAEERARIDRERAVALDVALQKETLARKEADHATRRARWLAIAAILVALAAGAAFVDDYIARTKAEKSEAAANSATRQAKLAEYTAQDAKTQTDNLRKRSEPLIGLITFVEKDLTAALESVGKASLASEFKKRLAEYQRPYADVIPKAGSWEDQVKDVRSQGDRLQATGDLSGALQLYLQGIVLAREQLRDGGGTDGSQAQMWLARFMRDQGDVLMTQRNLQQAKQTFQEALAIDQQLAQTKPDNLERQHDLSVSYGKVGDVQSAQSDPGAALKSYHESLAINQKLIAQEPNNASWQRDLASSYEKVGDAQGAQGDWRAALESYRDSLAINQKLIALDPGNASWRDLASSYGKVGDAQSAQGDPDAALKSYRESLVINQKLIAQEPNNASWQRDLASSYEKVRDVQSAQGNLPAEEAMWAVYGQQPKSGGKWSERHFNVEGSPKTAIPKPNQTVVAFENVNIRKNTPTWSDQIKDYVQGDIVGYIKPGDRVRALEVVDINPATDDTAWYWIRLSRLSKQ